MTDLLNTTQSEITYYILLVIKAYRMFDVLLLTWKAITIPLIRDPNTSLKYKFISITENKQNYLPLLKKSSLISSRINPCLQLKQLNVPPKENRKYPNSKRQTKTRTPLTIVWGHPCLLTTSVIKRYPLTFNLSRKRNLLSKPNRNLHSKPFKERNQNCSVFLASKSTFGRPTEYKKST